jgi:hypothetical protein
MMDLILIYIICEMPVGKMVKMLLKTNKSEMLKNKWFETISQLFLRACKNRHKPGSLTLKTIKTLLYKMLLQKSTDYLIRTIIDKLQNRPDFYSFNNDKQGTIEDLLINIQYWLSKEDYIACGIIVGKYSNTFFKKNYDKLYDGIKKLIVKNNKLERKRMSVKPKKIEPPKILKKPEILKKPTFKKKSKAIRDWTINSDSETDSDEI